MDYELNYRNNSHVLLGKTFPIPIPSLKHAQRVYRNKWAERYFKEKDSEAGKGTQKFKYY